MKLGKIYQRKKSNNKFKLVVITDNQLQLEIIDKPFKRRIWVERKIFVNQWMCVNE